MDDIYEQEELDRSLPEVEPPTIDDFYWYLEMRQDDGCFD